MPQENFTDSPYAGRHERIVFDSSPGPLDSASLPLVELDLTFDQVNATAKVLSYCMGLQFCAAAAAENSVDFMLYDPHDMLRPLGCLKEISFALRDERAPILTAPEILFVRSELARLVEERPAKHTNVLISEPVRQMDQLSNMYQRARQSKPGDFQIRFEHLWLTTAALYFDIGQQAMDSARSSITGRLESLFNEISHPLMLAVRAYNALSNNYPGERKESSQRLDMRHRDLERIAKSVTHLSRALTANRQPYQSDMKSYLYPPRIEWPWKSIRQSCKALTN